MRVLRNGSHNVFTVSDFFDTIDHDYEEGATVVCTLRDENAANITGAVGFSLAQVAGTTGRNTLYRAELANTVALPAGTEGTAVITATNTAGKVRKKTEPVRYED